MNVFEYFSKMNISGVNAGVLDEIFRGLIPGVFFNIPIVGTIMIKDTRPDGDLDRRVIKCTCGYYKLKDADKKLKICKTHQECFRALKAMNIHGIVPVGNCSRCHLACSRLEKSGAMQRIYKKK